MYASMVSPALEAVGDPRPPCPRLKGISSGPLPAASLEAFEFEKLPP